MWLDSSKRLGCSLDDSTRDTVRDNQGQGMRRRMEREAFYIVGSRIGEETDVERGDRGRSRGSSPRRLSRDPRCGAAAPERHLHRGGTHRSEEHTSELQSLTNLVCRLLLEKKKKKRQ